MKRALHSHVNGSSAALEVHVLDNPGPGGANHLYRITGYGAETNASYGERVAEADTTFETVLIFQNGPIKEVGLNGITHEALLAILIDRLHGFQNGPYANAYNAEALGALVTAQNALHRRTYDRRRQGVEGTMAVGTESKSQTNPGPGGGNAIMRYFTFNHLPDGPLRQTSALVSMLAQEMEQIIPDGAEKSAGLRKLLEAKDCFVRAVLPR